MSPTDQPSTSLAVRKTTEIEERADALFRVVHSFADLVEHYLLSQKFLGFADNTQEAWGRELRLAAAPNRLGAVPIGLMRPALVQFYINALAATPGKQHLALSAIKAVEKWGLVHDLLSRQITYGVECDTELGGHIPWTEEHLLRARAVVRRPELVRAIWLAAHTGQRRSDLVRMRPEHVRLVEGVAGIDVLQKKTKRQVWVPILSALSNEMRSWKVRKGRPILSNGHGEPWAGDGETLTNAWLIERDTNPDLAPLKAEGLVLHGLRGYAVVRLKRSGATALMVGDMVGMSVRMVEWYCRLSDQEDNAMAGVQHIERELSARRADDRRDRRAPEERRPTWRRKRRGPVIVARSKAPAGDDDAS